MQALRDKEVYELNAQREWIGYHFPRLLDILFDYWCEYRFWQLVKQTIPFHMCQCVLDVGCGVTSVLNVIRREFPGLELTGADPLADQYQSLYELDPSITWQTEFLESLGLPDDGFNVVCCTNALDHVEDAEAALREIRRVLSPGGAFLLTVDLFAKSMERNEGHPYSFTRKSLLSLLERNDFRNEWMRLNRSKIGMMKYADCRIRRGMSRRAVLLRTTARERARSYAKQLLGRGSLGELVLVARRG